MAGEKERLHWLPVHINDLTSDEKVLAMTTQEVGAYFLLLCAAWKSEPPCTVPEDDGVLARLARLSMKEWLKAKPRVLSPWKSNGEGRLYQKRLLTVHADVMAKVEQKRTAGRRGGKAKAEKKPAQPDIANPSGARPVLEQRHSFASSGMGSEPPSETVAGAYQPLTINQSVSSNEETHPQSPPQVEPEFQEPNPEPSRRRRMSAAPQPGLAEIEIDGEKVEFSGFGGDDLRWQAEFIRRWNTLAGVAKHESKALSSFNLNSLKSRLSESDWCWEKAFAKFPLFLPSGIWRITLGTFLEPGTVSKIMDGRYDERTEQAGLFGGNQSSPTRVRGGTTGNAVAEAMAKAAAARGE